MEMDTCPCSGSSLNRLVQPAVMAVLAREPLHGYLILQRLADMAMFHRQPPDPTGVYRVLKIMEQDGLVRAAWDLKARGPARRRFALTASGRACLKRWIETLETYEMTIADLLAVIRQKGKSKTAPKRGLRKTQ